MTHKRLNADLKEKKMNSTHHSLSCCPLLKLVFTKSGFIWEWSTLMALISLKSIRWHPMAGRQVRLQVERFSMHYQVAKFLLENTT